MVTKWLCILFLIAAALNYASVDENSYRELAITNGQEDDIRNLIHILANTSTMGLMFKKKELEQLGKRTHGIHPLRYLGFIYADSELKICMSKIWNKSMVSSRFSKEIGESLNEQLNKGELLQYIPGFASSLHVDDHQLMRFIDMRNWKGMLEFLNTH